MASFKKIVNSKGKIIGWQIGVEGARDPVTGKRNRHYRNIKGTKKEAMAVAREMENELHKGTLSHSASVPLASWMHTWLRDFLPNITETTRAGYREKINNYIIPELGMIPINALNAAHIQTFVNGLSKRGLSPKTIRNAYNNLNAARFSIFCRSV